MNFRFLIPVFFGMILLLQPMSMGSASAQSNEIPVWVKSNVQWWHQGIISDAEFVAALEHLISANIIQSPRISIVVDDNSLAKEQRISKNIVVPDYFKTNAKWWSDGMIDDATFVNSVEFLVEEEIIDSPSIKVIPASNDNHANILDEIISDDVEDLQTESINNGASNDSTIPDDDITNDDFTIEASPMSLTLSNGEYAEIIVKTKSLYGWESPIQITTPIVPSPMTYPPSYPHYVYPTPESETSSMIPVQIDGRACTGEYILRIFGYGEHPAPDRILEVHEVRVAINTVREPSLELDSLEDSITIVKGGSHTFQLSFKSLDYASYSYIMGTVDPFSPPPGVIIETAPTLVWVDEQTTAYATVTVSTSESTPAPFTFELPIYAETGLDCYNPYREETSVTVNVVPLIEEEIEMVQLIQVTALSIGDQQYPISQFTLWQWEGECDDQWHYHSSTGHAVAFDGITGIPDPDQENCGFGKVSSFPNLSGWMSQSEIDNFKAKTGYDPLNSEAMIGGSGP